MPAALALALLLPCLAVEVERVDFDAGAAASTPSLAVDPRRGLVLTWQTRSAGVARLHYALLDGQGRELRRGEVASGRDWFVNWADFPSLAILDNGDWVTHWLQKSAPGTYAYDVRVVRSRDGGQRWSAPRTPHADATPGEHGFVSLVPLASARVQLAWLDGRNAGDGHDGHEGPMSLRGAVLDRRGRVLAPAQVDALTCSCCQTDAARLGARTLLVYRDRSRDEVRDIAFAEADAQGRWSPPEPVHVDGWQIAACPVNGPALAVSGAQALVAWPTLAQPPLAVRYKIRGAQGWSPLHTLEQAAGTLGRVDVAAAAGDGFAVSWIGDAGSAGAALRVAYIDAHGRRGEIVEVAALAPDRATGHPRLAWHGGAHFLAWTESSGTGSSRIALARIEGVGGD
ncbi:MAG: hypothetical protein IT479_09630 [Xanthomonadales bacterium]|nr:hypothetical protein [Xanthomonadales bacterium]MCC6593523.1 hypothetical protein [Xanthomonadales bacterium]